MIWSGQMSEPDQNGGYECKYRAKEIGIPGVLYVEILSLGGSCGGVYMILKHFILENWKNTYRSGQSTTESLKLPKPFTVPCMDGGFKIL
jgi:hypothetical protein